MNRKTLVLLLAMAWFSPAMANNDQLQQWHAIRSLGFLICANLLIDYNDYETERDPRRAEVYHKDLADLQQLAGKLQAREELALIKELSQQIDELERLPRSESYRYGVWLNAALQAHARLEAAAAKQYAVYAGSVPETTLTLHTLSLDTGRILLLYQSHTSRVVSTYFMPVTDDSPTRLDQQISSAYSSLSTQAPELQDELTKQQRNYQFVRNKLVDYKHVWSPSGVGSYLDRNIRTLDRISANPALL